MNIQQLARQLIHGFITALGWRAANMMPRWFVIFALIVAIIIGFATDGFAGLVSGYVR